eukprot:TRINITY_DN4331_c0_g1_i5.p1 TRINITY_DN4331_c0_g1~~TRINITY_DN4331_c0_g1_i5.p1  ORF type:complete len:1022 (-),score=173.36 TRINITY_DN4331_c0_g1_i5:107-3094(-)
MPPSGSANGAPIGGAIGASTGRNPIGAAFARRTAWDDRPQDYQQNWHYPYAAYADQEYAADTRDARAGVRGSGNSGCVGTNASGSTTDGSGCLPIGARSQNPQRRSQWDERGPDATENAAGSPSARRSAQTGHYAGAAATGAWTDRREASAPVGGPSGRRSSWDDRYGNGGASNPVGADSGANSVNSTSAEHPIGSAGRRSQWDERGSNDEHPVTPTPATIRRGTWDDRPAAAGCGDDQATPSACAGRRSQWDDRGGGPSPQRPVVGAPAGKDSPSGGGAGGGCRGVTMATLGIRGIAPSATEEDLRRLLEQAKVVADVVHMPVDRETGKARGFAFVEFRLEATEDAEVEAEFAVHRLNGVDLCGRPISAELRCQPGDNDHMMMQGCAGGIGGMHASMPPVPPAPAQVQGLPNPTPVANFPGGKGGPVRGRPKTQICAYWRENRCTRGTLCAFAHGEQELDTHDVRRAGLYPQVGKGAPGPTAFGSGPVGAAMMGGPVGAAGNTIPGLRPPPPAVTLTKDNKFIPIRKTQLCVYWKEGRCTRGAVCSFAHGEDERGGRVPEVVARASRTAEAANLRGGRTAEELASEFRNTARKVMAETLKKKDGVQDSSTSGRDGRRGEHKRSRSNRGSSKGVVSFTKRDTLSAVLRAECRVTEATPAGKAEKPRACDESESPSEGRKARSPSPGGTAYPAAAVHAGTAADTTAATDKEAPTPAPFLLNEDGLGHLTECYGLGVRMLQEMGWKPGVGLGRRAEGWLEPVSIGAEELPDVRRGRLDRRCVGAKRPKKFVDSDASTSARSRDSSSSSSSRPAAARGGGGRSGAEETRRRSRSQTKSSASSQSSGRRRSKKAKKKSGRRSRSSRSRSRTTTTSSSRSSSSGSSRRRRRRMKRPRATTSPPKAGAAGTTTGTAGGAAAGVAVLQAQKEVAEPPEIQQAKKQVLAKLTVMRSLEPKEQRAKAFRELLREWHPDKNPERIEMATAVFQFLQKGKSLLNLK